MGLKLREDGEPQRGRDLVWTFKEGQGLGRQFLRKDVLGREQFRQKLEDTCPRDHRM